MSRAQLKIDKKKEICDSKILNWKEKRLYYFSPKPEKW